MREKMVDLIDRQAAIDALGERPMLSGDCEWEIAARKQYDDDRAAIENVPSAQPEIIRCKDCIHHEDESPGMVYCPNQVGGWVGEDFFCADGERRDNG